MRQKKTMEKAEATRAYLDAQDMGAAHKTIPNAKVGVMSSARIHLDRPLTEAEMKALVPVAEAHGFGVSDTGEGVTLMNFGDGPADGQGMKKLLTKGGLQAKLKAILPDMKSVERTRLDALSVDFSKEWSAGYGSGKATEKLLGLVDDPATPAIAAKIGDSPAVRAKALRNAERDQALDGVRGSVRPDIQNARRIFAAEGFEGLRRALKEGKVALPAVMAVVGAGGLMADGE